MSDAIIRKVTAKYLKDIPKFGPGDTIKVHVKITEGEKTRIQVYQGVVIGRKGGGVTENMTVRKMSSGIGVERVFPIHSPNIEKIEVVKYGRVRRSKLYYLRDKIGKAANIRERRIQKKK
jgi:large subunit ribosomal protein L19